MTQAEVIDPHIMELVDGRPRLIGGQCGACAEIDFPRQDFCRSCGAAQTSPVALADRGVLWSWTIQRFPPPSPPYPPTGGDFEPFGVGYVELPGQVIVESRLTVSDPAQLHIGMAMVLVEFPVVSETGSQTVGFAFRPDSEGAAR
ncbi:Zn-ribbon domain-containing OB-fold protein [Mycolicibacterium vaccae]|uniref:Zn-ribbon domain-containing OB-fold protein n=1 Tax=Mycolicibacterium vaccae TaxID=1810 RepID=UPI003D08F997